MLKIPIKYTIFAMLTYVLIFAMFTFFLESFVTILRKNEISLQFLSLFYALGLLNAFRVFWAPIIEKIKLNKFGHYKSWLFGTFLFVGIILLFISFLDIKKDLLLIILLVAFLSFSLTILTVAIDGLIYKKTPKKQRAIINSIKSFGAFLGTILGGGLGLIFYFYVGWQNTILALVGITCVILVGLFYQDEGPLEEEAHCVSISLKDFFSYWSKSNKWWFFLLLSTQVCASIFFALNSRILVDSGWKLEKIGLYAGISGYTFGMFFSLFVPKLITIFGKRKVLTSGLMGGIISLILLLFVLNGYNNTIFIIFVTAFCYCFFPQVAIVITTLMMDKIQSNKPAFEYTLQHSIYNFSQFFIAGFSMFLAGVIGYKITIIIGIFLGLIPIFISRKYIFKTI